MTYAAQYLKDQNAAAPITVATWTNKALTRRQQRETPDWEIIATLEAMVREGEAVQVESVGGRVAFIAA